MGSPSSRGVQVTGRTDEVHKEQVTVDRIYARLDELRAATRRRLAQVRRTGPSGSPQNRSERDAFATLYEDRLAQLEAVEDRLCFGRLDLTDGAVRHIGRIGLTDTEHTPVLTDWRAPAAQAFYRATAAHPDGVLRRRHLLSRGRQVTAIEDEVLDLDAARTGAAQLGELTGEGALFAAMASARTGRMHDIVATIQAEQDAIIRSSLEGALVVQGGPGTGKTAVALHRAAYLLYAHRQQLERSGVLLVGPSPQFLRYIDQVLPSLGET
ncbi:MAG: HelD family protein, partial [Cellulomonadaceae bacterium]